MLILLALAALSVAGCAAFFSVTGISGSFSGAPIAAGIMAGSLEYSKLVAASYLKLRWRSTSPLVKWVLSIGCVCLMILTSAGIFGFLSSAYQASAIEADKLEKQVAQVEQQKLRRQDNKLQVLKKQESTIESLKMLEGKMVKAKLTETKLLLEEQKNTKLTLVGINQELEEIEKQLTTDDDRIGEVRTRLATKTDIGMFDFIAKTTSTDRDTVARWFIFFIVVLFDPFAICLLLAFNEVLQERNKPVTQPVPAHAARVFTAEPVVVPIAKKKVTVKPVAEVKATPEIPPAAVTPERIVVVRSPDANNENRGKDRFDNPVNQVATDHGNLPMS